MIAQMKIKKLQKRIKKLQLNQDELIKFLGKELFNAVDSFYDIQGTIGLKTINLHNYTSYKNKLDIVNVLTEFKLTTEL